MFAVGTLNILTAVVILLNNMYSYSMQGSFKALYSVTGIFAINYLMLVQLYTGVMIVCLPHVRRLWMGVSDKDMRPQEEQQGVLAAGDLEAVAAAIGEDDSKEGSRKSSAAKVDAETQVSSAV